MSIAPVLAETPSTRNRTPKSEKEKEITPAKLLDTIEQHVLLDGFKIVVDLDKSRGSYLYNRVDNRPLIDLYGFFGSLTVGFNHPHFDDPDVQRDLLRAAKVKVANSDVYSAGYAEFVATFERVVGLPPLQRYLFIEGGALAVGVHLPGGVERHEPCLVDLQPHLLRHGVGLSLKTDEVPLRLADLRGGDHGGAGPRREKAGNSRGADRPGRIPKC